MNKPNKNDLENFALPLVSDLERRLGPLFSRSGEVEADDPYYYCELGFLKFNKKISIECWMEQSWLPRDTDSSHFWVGFSTSDKRLAEKLIEASLNSGYPDSRILIDSDATRGPNWGFKVKIPTDAGAPTYEMFETSENFIGIYNLGIDEREYVSAVIDFVYSVAMLLAEDYQEKVILGSNLSKTEKKALVSARVGQGIFRQKLLLNEPNCRFTGVDHPPFLRASHIKPWAKCDSNEERLDPENGFMLTPTFDCLFDKGHITINDDLSIMISSLFPKNQIEALALPPKLAVTKSLTRKQKDYLKYHREYVFKK